MTARACILGCQGPRLTAEERAFFKDADPWGFIVFTRNLETPDQVRRLTCDLRSAVGRNAPILIDQEGGRVQRLAPPHWRSWTNPLRFVEAVAAEDRSRAMFLRYQLIAQELLVLGIDTNCAPMADIAYHDTHPDIRCRCYGTAADDVAVLCRAVANGLKAGGVLPVLKHMPGHGRTPLDSHTDLPRIDTALDALEATDFVPFRSLSYLPMAMTAHIVVEALDREACVTLSRPAIRYLRDTLGFDGLLMTDDLSMAALSGSFADRATGALAAGCDIILHCNGDLDEMAAIAGATPLLTGAAAARADAALKARPKPAPADPGDLLDELNLLLEGVRDAG